MILIKPPSKKIIFSLGAISVVFLTNFSGNSQTVKSNQFNEEFHIKAIDLDKEIENQFFYIGIKRFLGQGTTSEKSAQALKLISKESLISINSANGAKHRAKNIHISWTSEKLSNIDQSRKSVIGPFSSYESAKKIFDELADIGIPSIIVNPNKWMIWVNEVHDIPESFNAVLINKSIDSRIVPIIKTESQTIVISDPVEISSDKGIVFNNQLHYGTLFLRKDSFGSWTLIKKLSVDDYLKGVLPHEIGANAPKEALKAQAVIGRSWALSNAKRYAADGYHLCVTTQCQVYKSSNNISARVKDAIESTTGQILVYDNKPVNSFYYASSGGITAQANESWQMNNLDYLTTKPDGNKRFSEQVDLPIDTSKKLNNFFQIDSQNAYGDYHSLFRWKRLITIKDLQKVLYEKKINFSNNDQLQLNIQARGPSGRVVSLEIINLTRKFKVILNKDSIRSSLLMLPSTLFVLNKTNNNNWEVYGGGFGHGVGLSQSGAIEMASNGLSYKKILDYYYPKTKIKKWSSVIPPTKRN
tara:strand:- start:22630 stop:24213 length:1584 start_codon:yes stop_codon:yes gene_type:complete